MKRRTAVIATAILLLLLCACKETPAETGESASPKPESTAPVITEQTPAPAETPEPTPSPIPVQPPVDTPVPTETAVNAEALEAYFEDSVFIGDSIMEGIRQYVAQNRSKKPTLSNAQFLASTVGVSVTDLMAGEPYGPFYRYNGENQYLTKILPQMGCKRIFLQLGLNDMAGTNPAVDPAIAKYSELIDLLQSMVPEAEIIVMTNLPKVASDWLPDYTPNRQFGNDLITEFVDKLIDMCDSREIPYVDTHAALEDENGCLPGEYCSDNFVHLNSTGAAAVVDELYRFAAERIG